MKRFALLLVLGSVLGAALPAEGTLLGGTSSPNTSGFLGNNSYPSNNGMSGSPSGTNPFSGNNANAGATNLMPGLSSRAFPLASQLTPRSALGMGKSRDLQGHWALGVDSIPATAIASPSGSMVALPDALSLRWWATERLAIDVLAGGNYNSAQAGRGELSPLVSSSPGMAVYAGALGLRYNLSELSHDLLSQLVLKVSGAQSAESISGWSGQASETTLAVFVGGGFEAFVPGWDWLSLEATIGVTGFSQSLTPPSGNGGAQTVSGLGLAGSGFSPVDLAAHIYF
ncbi:MAG TPA: hypothetical protein VK914_12415 [bacterium]|jgi:hypothetical protein|nr:hypothetical protein [bacterium]